MKIKTIGLLACVLLSAGGLLRAEATHHPVLLVEQGDFSVYNNLYTIGLENLSGEGKIGEVDSLKADFSPLKRSMWGTVPLLLLGGAYTLHDKPIRDLRHTFAPRFRNTYDDFLQFAPLGVQLGLHAFGVKGISGGDTRKLLVSDAATMAYMMGMVSLGKTTFGVRRPDGSANNSYPSGHTTMAFASATLLHMEYGARYPWLSALGYGMSTAVGVGRILNNRHWIGDVVTGAALGVLCAQLGYLTSDLIFGGIRSYEHLNRRILPDVPWMLYAPLSYAHSRGYFDGDRSREIDVRALSASLGVQWMYDRGKGAFVFAEVGGENHLVRLGLGTPDVEEMDAPGWSLALGWGRRWRTNSWLSLEADLGVVSKWGTSRYSIYKGEVGKALSDMKDVFTPRLRGTAFITLGQNVGLRISGGYELFETNLDVCTPQTSARVSIPRWRVASAITLSL